MRSRKVEPGQFLLDTIALCPPLAARLSDAKLVSPVTATGNYSYVASHCAGRNYLLLGDAFAFIDPMFSSGVLLAMQSAFTGADTIETCLDRPREAPAAIRAFDASTRRGLDAYSWFIYRIMTPGLRHMLMNPTRRFRLQSAVLSVLAGDVFRDSLALGLRLRAFKVIYYVFNALDLKRSIAAWQQRRLDTREARAGVETTAA
jgi:2-polyprenyl-6-methoxyphenol hydroxylase-like FAD-dependent oxidoreductase